ncbi:hypothetical protein GGX14DRAFT_386111 [Mycena pura]|uniref:Secreted protein n=1 Tax=Mycena pura TaxID=153505 RepID=A0AAD7E437_9AGAR|nr:hypothetical protein GGX14DRAFT_386111 [Mycena pura]
MLLFLLFVCPPFRVRRVCWPLAWAVADAACVVRLRARVASVLAGADAGAEPRAAGGLLYAPLTRLLLFTCMQAGAHMGVPPQERRASVEARWHAGRACAGITRPVPVRPTQAGIHERNTAPVRRDPPSSYATAQNQLPIVLTSPATLPVDTVSATGWPTTQKLPALHSSVARESPSLSAPCGILASPATVPVDTVSAAGRATAKKRVVAVDDRSSHKYLKNVIAVPGSGTRSARDLDGRGGLSAGRGLGRGGGLGAGRGLVVPVGIPRHTCAGLGRLKQVTADSAKPAVACPDLLSSWWADRSRPGHTRAEVVLTGAEE